MVISRDLDQILWICQPPTTRHHPTTESGSCFGQYIRGPFSYIAGLQGVKRPHDGDHLLSVGMAAADDMDSQRRIYIYLKHR